MGYEVPGSQTPGSTAEAGAPVTPGPGSPAAGLEEAARELADIDAALARLDDGTYGSCAVCGAALADETLEGAPLVRQCPLHGGPQAAPG